MPDPCDTCAFRQGSVTHESEPHNRLKGMICAAAGIPFYCHHGWAWEDADIAVVKGRFVVIGEEIDLSKIRLCAGWLRDVKHMKERGQFAVTPEVRALQKELGGYALAALKEFIGSPDGEAKDRAEKRLWELAEIVMQKPEAER